MSFVDTALKIIFAATAIGSLTVFALLGAALALDHYRHRKERDHDQ
jgi:hypothetical protein